jgi:hypothetical protein
MSYKFYAWWGRREESAEVCAQRMAQMLENLAAVHPVLSRWNKQAMTRKAANAPFCAMPPRLDELTRIFEKGRHYRDHPREPMLDMGFSISAWNGHDDDYGVSLAVHAGAYTDRPPDPNNVRLDLHHPTAADADFINASVLKKMNLAVAEAWQPSWAVVETWADKGETKDAKGFPLRPWGG